MKHTNNSILCWSINIQLNAWKRPKIILITLPMLLPRVQNHDYNQCLLRQRCLVSLSGSWFLEGNFFPGTWNPSTGIQTLGLFKLERPWPRYPVAPKAAVPLYSPWVSPCLHTSQSVSHMVCWEVGSWPQQKYPAQNLAHWCLLNFPQGICLKFDLSKMQSLRLIQEKEMVSQVALVKNHL